MYYIARRIRNLKATEIAGKVGVTAAYIYKVEAGQSEPSLNRITKYAEALRLDMTTFFRLRECCKQDKPFEQLISEAAEIIVRYDVLTRQKI